MFVCGFFPKYGLWLPCLLVLDDVFKCVVVWNCHTILCVRFLHFSWHMNVCAVSECWMAHIFPLSERVRFGVNVLIIRCKFSHNSICSVQWSERERKQQKMWNENDTKKININVSRQRDEEITSKGHGIISNSDLILSGVFEIRIETKWCTLTHLCQEIHYSNRDKLVNCFFFVFKKDEHWCWVRSWTYVYVCVWVL